MIKQLYVHNYRCLENFELNANEMNSVLFIGKNGTGKSTILAAVEIFQKICRGMNRLRDLEKLDLLGIKDFARGRSDIPIRLELNVKIKDKDFSFRLDLELPENFRELKVLKESLFRNGQPIYTRQEAQISLVNNQEIETKFGLDWHLIALPVIQARSETDPIAVFRNWLARIIFLDPIPMLMTGESKGESLEPQKDGSNFGDWFTGLLSQYPAAYKVIDNYLRGVLPDIQDFRNELIGKESKNMIVRFSKNSSTLNIDFAHLSDGEKCFFICAAVLAANEFYGPLICLWDEPDNYLSLPEIGHFLETLRRAFKDNSQIFVTSHHPETIRRFSEDNTFLLERKSHLEPTRMRLIRDLEIEKDLIETLILDDFE